MGKNIIDFVTQRDASRGRKSKAGGGIKSKAAQLYTPLKKVQIRIDGVFYKHLEQCDVIKLENAMKVLMKQLAATLSKQ